MKLGKNNVRSNWIIASTMATLLVGTSANAAPGALGTKPLIMDTLPVQPNIYFLVDDSGSMNWEDLLNAGTQFPATSEKTNNGLDFSPNNALNKRLLCRGFNVMAYNPDVTYLPWAGEDTDGNAFTDLTLTTARDNPHNNSVTDISNHVYVTWNDNDNDGEYDGPGSTDLGSSSTTGDECDISNPVSVSSLTSAQKTNYANWYSYYRKREYVAKRALSQVIKDSTARVGLGSLHNHNNIRTPVTDIDDISTPVDTTARTNKTALLNNLFNIDSNNGTPLRNGLKNVGEYFAGNLSSSWGSSPILSPALGGQCQKNFAVVMSDGFWNGSSPGVGNTDGDNNTDWDGDSYADKVKNTLADVAMKYYETDLKPDDSVGAYEDVVPTVEGIDENSAQHLVTYTVAFGVNGTLTEDPPNRTDSFNWPTPSSGTATTIDDMRHAAWNGRGKFLSAGDPQQLISALSNAIQEIDSLSGTSSAAALNTTSIQTGSHLYMSSYDSKGWFGDLVAYKFDGNGVIDTDDSAYLAWPASAGDALNSRDYNSRKIYTVNTTPSTPVLRELKIGVTDTQKADLLTNMPGTETDTSYLGKVVRFIYGDHTNEIGGSGSDYFRKRGSHRLGDIVHSAPIHVGVPNAPYPDNLEAVSYSSFKSDQSSRNGTVFVGSNDGMLHAFNAKNNDTNTIKGGVEQFAYIPNLLFSTAPESGLHYLADPLYEHKYYADLTPTVADIYDDGWKTILVGGLRGGGKGIFALDVTSEGNPEFKFEFTHPDMGYTFSEIQIAKTNNNGRWAAIFGNGYNNTGDGTAKLIIVYLDDGTSKIISTDEGSVSNGDCADASSDCNGLSSPALADLNGDGKIDRVYAGDVHGNMWSFNISQATESEWSLSFGSNEPLFTACRSTTSPCPAADRQSITSKPALARHPTQRGDATATNLMVMFGTGQFVTPSDVTNSSTQAVYGIWDRGDSNLVASDLVKQSINQGAAIKSISGHEIRTVSDLEVTYATELSDTDHGWFFNLPTDRERVVVNPVTYGSLLFVNTMIPETPEVCSAQEGTGWLMAVDIFNGGQPEFQPMDVNGDNEFNNLDYLVGSENDPVFAVGTKVEGIPTESRFVSNKRITVDSDKDVNIQSVQGLPPGNPSRMSWTAL